MPCPNQTWIRVLQILSKTTEDFLKASSTPGLYRIMFAKITTQALRAIPFVTVLASMVATGCGGSSSSLSLDSGSVRSEVARSLQGGFIAHGTTSDTGQGGGATRSSGAQFDDFLGVWTKENGDGRDLFTDEACTQPAGRIEDSVSFDPEKNGTVVTSNVEITGGPLAGYSRNTTMVYRDGETLVSGNGRTPENGDYTLEGKWVSGGDSSFTMTTRKSGEEARAYSVLHRQDGTSRVVFDGKEWYRFTLNYQADDSGTGTVTGNSELLPAEVAWDTAGTGKITFKDGSVREFSGFSFDTE